MTSILDKSGNTIGFLYQNMILDPAQQEVVGLLLGNCVFGRQPSPVGKFFNDTFRKKNGKIIGKLGPDAILKKAPKDAHLSLQAWKILSQVKDHVCIWIDEKKSWTKQDFMEYLAAEKDLVEED